MWIQFVISNWKVTIVASKSKKKKKLIKLVNKETGHTYFTHKNAKLEGKLELKKYDPKLRKHTVFTESK